MAFQLNPQQQEWWQKFLQQRQASLQQQMQSLHAAQPWQQPGYSRFANPLMGRSEIPGPPGVGPEMETDPQAAMMGYFMQGAGTSGEGGMMNPMMQQMLLSGSTGFGGQ